MDPKHLCIDDRWRAMCAYCAGPPDTKDHIPPKVFLDSPLPDTIYTVEACKACNQDASGDKEYFACFIECVICGTTDKDALNRSKVRAALEHSPSLKARIEGSYYDCVWHPEPDRINRVVAKLAQGHVTYEYSECGLGQPNTIDVSPIAILSDFDRSTFEDVGSGSMTLWPEIGSRGFLRAAGARPYESEPGPWIIVQDGRYRYAVSLEPNLVVRIVISEYLACVVQW